jgi:6-phosphogluconolactonase
MLIYIGAYTRGTTRGICRLQLDPATGDLSSPQLAAETKNPSFLALHPTRPLLYAVGEISDHAGQKSGAVNAFAIEAGGALRPLNQQPSGGPGPCFVTVDHSGRNVLVANYAGGSVAVLPIDADGRLRDPSAVVQHSGSGPNPKRQDKPHAHSIYLPPDNRFALAADLGIDRIMLYRFDAAAGTLAAHDPPAAALAPGAGPRHLAFHPHAGFLYVINELASTVTAFVYDAAAGALREIQTLSTLPHGFTGENTTAEVQVHPSGRFLYGSNRGHDSIAIFAIDPATGRLTARGHESTRGRTPRHFGIDPAGSFLLAAHQDSGDLFVFRIDPDTGGLAWTGASARIDAAVCVRFVPEPLLSAAGPPDPDSPQAGAKTSV